MPKTQRQSKPHIAVVGGLFADIYLDTETGLIVPRRGGSAPNIAIGIRDFAERGIDVSLVAAHGEDRTHVPHPWGDGVELKSHEHLVGRKMLAELDQAGINTNHTVEVSGLTGRARVTVRDRSELWQNYIGMTWRVPPGHFRKLIAELHNKQPISAAIVGLDLNYSAAAEAISQLAELKIPVMLALAPNPPKDPPRLKEFNKYILPVLPKVRLVTGNRMAFAAFFGRRVDTTEAAVQMATHITDGIGVPLVALTSGPREVIAKVTGHKAHVLHRPYVSKPFSRIDAGDVFFSAVAASAYQDGLVDAQVPDDETSRGFANSVRLGIVAADDVLRSGPDLYRSIWPPTGASRPRRELEPFVARLPTETPTIAANATGGTYSPTSSRQWELSGVDILM